MIRTTREIAAIDVKAKDAKHSFGRNAGLVRRVVRCSSLICFAVASTVACNDDSDDITGAAGSSATNVGGSANKGGSGGKSSGGSKATGGSSAVTSGGKSNPGGATAAGGSETTETNIAGGATSVGGSSAAGGTSAATSGVGGATSANGGTTSIGGSSTASGGTSSIGGSSTASGGTSSIGGSSSANGGTTSTVGTTTAAGGTTSAGGATTALGGMTSDTGGTSSTGGTAGSGGTTNPPTPKVLLRYDFDDVAALGATDSSTSHRDGTLTNVTLATSGRSTAAASFASADASILMPAGLTFGTDTISVSAWVKLTSSDAGSRLFTLAAGVDSYLHLTLNDGGTPAGISLKWMVPSGTEQVLSTPTQLPLNVWKHVTVVTSATLSQIYIDGKIVGQSSNGMPPSALGSNPTSVVGNSELNTVGMRGLVDEFQLYDGSLTNAEILALAWPQTDYSIYRFDEASGDDIFDGSARAKNGKLVGGSRVAGVFGSGIKLANAAVSGVATQYVDLGTGVLQGCTNAWTFASWYNAEAVRYSAPIFIALDSEVGATTAVAMFRFAPNYKAGVSGLSLSWFDGASTTRSAYGSYNLGLAQWRHVAVTRSGADVYYYVDGTAVNATAISFASAANIDPTKLANAAQNYLGRNRTAGTTTDQSLDGSLDEVLISCRAYTASEIKHLAYKP